MTVGQRLAFRAMFYPYASYNNVTFLHGDCIGADEIAHSIVREYKSARVQIFPPLSGTFRANCNFDSIMPEKEYIERNHDIVDSSDFMIACPNGEEKVRSGTWATIRYARKQNKRIVIIKPDGNIDNAS